MPGVSLVDWAITAAEVAEGKPAANGSVAGIIERISLKSPRWSEKEDQFLKENLGKITEAEIGKILGRSENGVHLRAKRTNLPRPSKDPNYLTAHKAAEILGEDGHVVCYWIDSGLLAGERLAGLRVIRRVRKDVFLEWVLDPEHWIWFDPFRVPDPRLRKLIDQKAKEWGDEWWNSRRVADFFGIDPRRLLDHCKRGRIHGVQARNRGGRDKGYWAFWFYRKSEVMRARDTILAVRKIKHSNRADKKH